MIYLLRWRIEKVYNTAKNKLEETKAGSVGERGNYGGGEITPFVPHFLAKSLFERMFAELFVEVVE